MADSRLRFLVCISLLACVTAAPHTISTNLVIRNQTFSGGTLYDGSCIYKNGNSRKLRDGGRLTAYLAGEDGIYFHDDATEKLEKHGTITESIIDIKRATKSDDLYIITEDHTVYKVTEGDTKTEITEAKGSEDIVLDKNDDVFFYFNSQLFHNYARVFFYKNETSEVKLISDKGSFSVKFDGTSTVYVPTEAEKAKEGTGSEDIKTILKNIHDKEKAINIP